MTDHWTHDIRRQLAECQIGDLRLRVKTYNDEWDWWALGHTYGTSCVSLAAAKDAALSAAAAIFAQRRDDALAGLAAVATAREGE
jgi:hypothetical protein